MEDMNINSVKAKVLTAALPYIQKYNGKTVVVKYGGNAMIHPLLKKAVMSDIILLKLVGIKRSGAWRRPRNQQHAGASGYPLQICEWSAVYG